MKALLRFEHLCIYYTCSIVLCCDNDTNERKWLYFKSSLPLRYIHFMHKTTALICPMIKMKHSLLFYFKEKSQDLTAFDCLSFVLFESDHHFFIHTTNIINCTDFKNMFCFSFLMNTFLILLNTIMTFCIYFPLLAI